MTNLVGPGTSGTSGTSGTPLSHGCGRCKVGRTQRRLPEQESQLEALQRPGTWPGPGLTGWNGRHQWVFHGVIF